MVQVQSLISAELIDSTKTAAFLAACFINRGAFVVIAFHLAGELLFAAASEYPVMLYCMLATLYSINAAINIKLSYQIRQALICIGGINWLAAVDFYLSCDVTYFYLCYPWLINGLDVFILFLLLSNGGRQIVGTYRPWHSWLVNL